MIPFPIIIWLLFNVVVPIPLRETDKVPDVKLDASNALIPKPEPTKLVANKVLFSFSYTKFGVCNNGFIVFPINFFVIWCCLYSTVWNWWSTKCDIRYTFSSFQFCIVAYLDINDILFSNIVSILLVCMSPSLHETTAFQNAPESHPDPGHLYLQSELLHMCILFPTAYSRLQPEESFFPPLHILHPSKLHHCSAVLELCRICAWPGARAQY